VIENDEPPMSIEPSEIGQEMNCGEMERSLEAYLDGELHEQDRAEADAHLVTCSACRQLADTQVRARAMIRAKLWAAMGPRAPAGRAPEALRERIAAALAHQNKPFWQRAFAPVPLASAAACAAGVLVVLAIQGGPDSRIDEAIREHNRNLPLELTAAGPESERTAVERLRPWLDFNPRPPRFQNPDVHFVGAGRTYLRNQPAAYIRYDLPRGRLGLFIFDDPDQSFGKAGRTVQLGPATTLRIFSSRGYNVAVWRQNEIVYSLVSDLNEDELVHLVKTASDR
jgi:anti-sigma factor RsiW